MEQTQTKQKERRLEMSLESMEKIEDRVGQWMILDEHWTRYNLNRREQLGHAERLFKEIKAEIRTAYKACPDYSEV
jgi:hypothetical protein